MNASENALDILQRTSRTFYIPISRLPSDLLEAVASAYLCMRAIDEIEDHLELDRWTKAKLLRTISLNLQSAASNHAEVFSTALNPQVESDGSQYKLAEVTLRLGEWALLAPESIAPRIWDATAAMADRMAHWAEVNWAIRTQSDLDRYTFSVAGAVGLLLSDLWAWYDGTQTNRTQAVGFGRGLQAVNILRNYHEDRDRGVNFLPDDWNTEDLYSYARNNLKLADAYTQALPPGPALDFCQIPLALAYGTLDVLALGKQKLSRSDVLALVEQVMQ